MIEINGILYAGSAKELLKIKMPIEQIMQITKLTKEEIEKIK